VAEGLVVWLLAVVVGAVGGAAFVLAWAALRALVPLSALAILWVNGGTDRRAAAQLAVQIPSALWLGIKAGAIGGGVGGFLFPVTRWRLAIFPVAIIAALTYTTILFAGLHAVLPLQALHDPVVWFVGIVYGSVIGAGVYRVVRKD
jgi:hypothetical protein